MTDEEKNAVVDRHNQLRATRNATYQPCTAADMEAMTWDNKLAAESQAWADACVGDHAPGAGSQFGENLFMSYPDTSYSTDDLVSGVQDWYSEIVDSVWHINDKRGMCKPGTTVGHYWQVIWAKSKRVGCGVAACTKSLTISGADHGSGILMVCRYDPPASLKGSGETNSLPYIFGKPCAACPDHCSNGLCTAPPTRCLDKLGGDNAITIGSTRYDSCKQLVEDPSLPMPWCTQLAKMMKAEDTCALSCGKCTVPEGVGREYCEGYNASAHKETENKAPKKTQGTQESNVKKVQDKTKSNGQESGSDDEEENKPEKGGKEDMEAKMREQMKAKMREQMKSKMKAKMTEDSGKHDDDSSSLGGSHWQKDSGAGGGGGELDSHGELEGGWDDEMGDDDWSDDDWGDDDWSSGGDDDWGWNSEASSKKQMVADVAASRPPQVAEREMAPAPTPPPRKMTAGQIAATLP